MSKIKDFAVNVKNNWNDEKTAKLAKILSFFSGLIFSILGVIFVAIWKYIFSNKEEKNKYCIRLSIIGVITRTIICAKLFAIQMFGFGFPFNDIIKDKKVENTNVVNPAIYDDFFERKFREMDYLFERQRRMFENFFVAQNQEMIKDIDKKYEKNAKDVKTTKNVSLDKDGYKKTVIEEKGPNSYKKIVVKEKYFQDNNKDNKSLENKKKNDKKKNKNK